jgi:hypothetical protein
MLLALNEVGFNIKQQLQFVSVSKLSGLVNHGFS